ncbi:MAG: hypothetical protein WCD79_22465 [Chthoniobacteraceae bacterium]
MRAPPWDEFDGEYPHELVESIRHRFELGEPFALSAEQFVASTPQQTEMGRKLLEALVALHWLYKTTQHLCVCGASLTEAEAAADTCRHCGQAFIDVGKPEKQTLYGHEGRRRRDARWVLVLHGMNTRGPWQEELNWLVSRMYGHAVPVAIYKYGLVLVGVVLSFRQRALTRQLITRIQRLGGQSEKTGFGGVPDVLAHSFGTWLLGHALQSDPTLRVGRVILTGCILRPDFDWAALISKKQVEAVLCHYGTKDFWAGVSHYVIPDSGPSGRRGFNDRKQVVHFEGAGLHHSDFFLEKVMPEFFREIWQPFLTLPGPEELQSGTPPANLWKQSIWPLRARLLRWLILLILLSVLVIAIVVFAIGFTTLFRWLR